MNSVFFSNIGKLLLFSIHTEVNIELVVRKQPDTETQWIDNWLQRMNHFGSLTMQLLVRGIPTEYVKFIRAAGPDANGQTAQTRLANEGINPCRHCLQLIAPIENKLILAYRPFSEIQPYAEVGPIFLHERECAPYESNALPNWFQHLQPALIRGYGRDHLIRYETGSVLPGSELEGACKKILSDTKTAYVHIRSKFNCFQCRVDRS